MEFFARYQDGQVAEIRDVICLVDLAADPIALVVLDAVDREVIDRWPADDCYLLHTRMAELRIANRKRPAGARIAVSGIADMRTALKVVPTLTLHQRNDGWTQVRILALSTVALASVVVAYLYGIPLLSSRLVEYLPPAWEKKVGDTVAAQIEASTTGGKGYDVCDANPDSTANRAIARFVRDAFDGLGSPFEPKVTVVRSTIPNAYALPGGRAYYLSSMIEASYTSDEFAGVLAHELGHVYYRHGMQTLIDNSTTGLLVGFVLGDMTGLSVAGAVGSSLIKNSFSRQAEAQADSFAAATAHRLGFSAKGLADVLERVAGDDEFTRALALFSNHPLTAERRAALDALDSPLSESTPAFSPEEWAAIRDMCPLPPPPPLPKLVASP